MLTEILVFVMMEMPASRFALVCIKWGSLFNCREDRVPGALAILLGVTCLHKGCRGKRAQADGVRVQVGVGGDIEKASQ